MATRNADEEFIYYVSEKNGEIWLVAEEVGAKGKYTILFDGKPKEYLLWLEEVSKG